MSRRGRGPWGAGVVVACCAIMLSASFTRAQNAAEIKALVDQLMDGDDPKAVAKARENIIQTYLNNPGLNEDTKAANAKVVVADLGPGFAAEKELIVRLNCAIVAGACSVPEVVPHFKTAMTDKNEAVRLLAVKSVGKLGQSLGEREEAGPRLPDAWVAARNDMVALMTKIIKDGDKSNRIIQQAFDSLVKIGNDSANDALIESLIVQAPRRFNDVAASVDGERDALFHIYRTVAVDQGAEPAKLKRLSIAAFHYLQVCLKAKEDPNLPKNMVRSWDEMVTISDTTLNQTITNLGGTPPARLPVGAPATAIRARIVVLVEILVAPPISIPRDELNMQPANGG